MTFASSRASIEEPQEISKILNDDNYTLIDIKDVLPGDIIIYFNNEEAIHSGIVVQIQNESPYIHTVLSKWGFFREAIHPFNFCPYIDKSDAIKFYRIFI